MNPFRDLGGRLLLASPVFNPTALRAAKTLWSFDRSECNRIKMAECNRVKMAASLWF